MAAEITMAPIGWVVSSRKDDTKDDWDRVEARIELDPAQLPAEATQGLDTYSHIMVVFHFHLVPPEKIEWVARHPRNNPAWPRVGTFAQRSKNHPNRIGVTVCRLLRCDGLVLHVEGLDALDGTPVMDIKPWANAFGARGETHEPAWMSELMKNYWRKDG